MSIPLIIIKNKIYENQKFLEIIPVINEYKIVWIIRQEPRERGCFMYIAVIFIITENTNMLVISENSLIKILILEIKDGVVFFWSFKRLYLNFDLQDQYFI